MWNFFLHVAN